MKRLVMIFVCSELSRVPRPTSAGSTAGDDGRVRQCIPTADRRGWHDDDAVVSRTRRGARQVPARPGQRTCRARPDVVHHRVEVLLLRRLVHDLLDDHVYATDARSRRKLATRPRHVGGDHRSGDHGRRAGAGARDRHPVACAGRQRVGVHVEDVPHGPGHARSRARTGSCRSVSSRSGG